MSIDKCIFVSISHVLLPAYLKINKLFFFMFVDGEDKINDLEASLVTEKRSLINNYNN